jgi:hypothetical protein
MTDRFDGLEVLKIHHVLRKAGMADRMARGWALQQVETLFRNVVANVTYGMLALHFVNKSHLAERERESASHDDGRPSTKLDQAIGALTFLLVAMSLCHQQLSSSFGKSHIANSIPRAKPARRIATYHPRPAMTMN